MGLIQEGTSVYPHLNDSELVVLGSPASATSIYTDTTAYDFDAGNDYITGPKVYANGFTKGSAAFTVEHKGTGFVWSTRSSSGVGVSVFWEGTGRVWARVDTSVGVYLASIIDFNSLVVGTVYQITVCFDLVLQDVDIFIDGVEATYQPGQQNVKSGSPASSLPTTQPVWIGAQNVAGSPANFNGGHNEFYVFWDNRFLTGAEAATLNTEFLNYPPPAEEVSGVYQPIYPKIYSGIRADL